MLLYEAECVICENIKELRQAAEALVENGYKMYSGNLDPITRWTHSRYGFRWMIHQQFPSCVASIDYDQKNDVVNRNELRDGVGCNPHTWISFSDFIQRCQPVDVEDLL